MFKHLTITPRSLSICLAIYILGVINSSFGQSVINLREANSPTDLENVSVTPLYSDSLASSFLIWIIQGVKAHKHVYHSEQVYVLQGEAVMRLGEQVITIKPGDIINIPKNTVHEVKVTSDEPMQVISFQAPFFEGKDRVFVESKE